MDEERIQMVVDYYKATDTPHVLILIRRLLVLRRSLGGHGLSSHERWGHATIRLPPRHA